jgi:hypothetical protein
MNRRTNKVLKIALTVITLFITSPRARAEEKPAVGQADSGVLPADKYFGRAAAGYKAAKQAPEVCAKVFCYCGCDATDSHSSLLDCFTSTHGVDCAICQDEAIISAKLKSEGRTIPEIQKAIDDGFKSQYPWLKPSLQLMSYREKALHASEEQAKAINPSGAKEGTPEAEAAKKGSCCGEH